MTDMSGTTGTSGTTGITVENLADDIISIADWAHLNDHETPALILLTLADILKRGDAEALARWKALADEWRPSAFSDLCGPAKPPAGGAPGGAR